MAAYEVNVEDVEPMSRTYQYRKVMKPMLERKRRARINKCLDELKDLMVGALQTEGESITKLEKADVLELTVRHLRKLKQHHALAIPSQNQGQEKFREGFRYCATEVRRFVQAVPGVDVHISARLINHLGNWASQYETVSTKSTPSSPVNSPAIAPRVYTPPASPQESIHHHQPNPRVAPAQPIQQHPHPQQVSLQPLALTTKAEVPSAVPTIVYPSSSSHPATAYTSSVVSQPRMLSPTVITKNLQPLVVRTNQQYTASLQAIPVNYVIQQRTVTASGPQIKIEVPAGSPVWRPW